MYRIVWQDSNGSTGYGEFTLTLDLAIAWVDAMRKKYPDMIHKYESEKN